MSKFTITDSGSAEGPAILGEDLGTSLAILLQPVQVPAFLRSLASLDERTMVLALAAALLAVELGCLAFAYRHGNVTLAALVLGLMVAEVRALLFGHSPASSANPETEPVLYPGSCVSCRQHFVLEVRPGKGGWTPATVPTRRQLRYCSRSCEPPPTPGLGLKAREAAIAAARRPSRAPDRVPQATATRQ